MKKCPNCQKTFDDNMKFCQTDGTPLVVVADNKPEADPYATMVANKSDLEIPPEEPKEEVKEEAPKLETDPYATMVASSQPVKKDKPNEDDGDLLDVLGDDKKEAEIDPMATMVVSGNTADNIKVNIPEEKPKDEPIADDASEAQTILSPDIPKFNEPKIDPPNLNEPNQNIEDKPPRPEAKMETPSSPFEAEKPRSESKPKAEEPGDSKSAPIPSPFDDSMPPGYAPPSTPPFEPPKEAFKPEPLNEPKKEKPPKSPFGEPDKPAATAPKQKNWNTSPTPSAPVANAGNQGIANNNQFDSPPVSRIPATEGQNQTFAIISLVSGILSMLCCFSIITGPLAIGMGYLAKKNIAENPAEYTGDKLALIGMILGGVGIILFILMIILNFASAFAGLG